MKYWLLFVMIVSIGMAPAAYPQPPEPPEEAELARELEEAKKAVQEAARHYAELAAGQADRVMRNVELHHVVRPRVRLGVTLDGNERHDRGVVIREVAEAGPAADAGLRSGDILLAIGDNRLESGGNRVDDHPVWRVRKALADANPGDEVVVRYQRGGNDREAAVVLAEAPPLYDPASLEDLGERIRASIHPGMEHLGRWLGRPMSGLELVRMSDGLGRYFGTEKGLLVVRAPEGNPLGVRDGDVILNIDGRVPESPVHALRILRSYVPGERISMDIMRDRQRQAIEAVIPEDSG